LTINKTVFNSKKTKRTIGRVVDIQSTKDGEKTYLGGKTTCGEDSYAQALIYTIDKIFEIELNYFWYN